MGRWREIELSDEAADRLDRALMPSPPQGDDERYVSVRFGRARAWVLVDGEVGGGPLTSSAEIID